MPCFRWGHNYTSMKENYHLSWVVSAARYTKMRGILPMVPVVFDDMSLGYPARLSSRGIDATRTMRLEDGIFIAEWPAHPGFDETLKHTEIMSVERGIGTTCVAEVCKTVYWPECHFESPSLSAVEVGRICVWPISVRRSS